MLTSPLTKLLWKDVKFQWTKQCQESFNKLKRCLTKAPILILPTPGKKYTIYSDASHNGLGYVLMQDKNIIAYAHAILSHTREIIPPMIWSLQQFSMLLRFRDITCMGKDVTFIQIIKV